MNRRCILTVVACLLILTRVTRAVEHTADSLDLVRTNLQQKKAVLIDVRELKEWRRGHLKDASLVPLSELRKLPGDAAIQTKLAPSLPKDRIIYCHCASGVRVLTAASILGKLGYDIRPLEAGFDDLRDAGFVAEKP